MVFVLALIVVLAVLGPLAGSDSRDGLDWAPGHFWSRRRTEARRLRRTGSPAPAAAGRAAADRSRTIPAAG